MRKLFIIYLLFLSSNVYAQEWEYLTIEIRDQLFDKSLNLIGNEGWELVSSRRVISKIRGIASECIFKRKKGFFKSGKSVSDTKILLIDLELNYINQLQAEEEKKKRANEEAKRLVRLEREKRLEEEQLFINEFIIVTTLDTLKIDVQETVIRSSIRNNSNQMIKKAFVKCSIFGLKGELLDSSVLVLQNLMPENSITHNFNILASIHLLEKINYKVTGLELE